MTGIAIAVVTNVAASSSSQASRRLASSQAASGRKSAVSSGTACGRSETSRSAGVMPFASATLDGGHAQRVGLRAEREQRRGGDEAHRGAAGVVVDAPPDAAVALGDDGQRGAGDEARHAGQRVEREHEPVAVEDEAEVLPPAGAAHGEHGRVRHAEQRDHPGGDEEQRRDAEAAPPPRRPRRGGAAPATRAASPGCPPSRGREPAAPSSSPRQIGTATRGTGGAAPGRARPPPARSRPTSSSRPRGARGRRSGAPSRAGRRAARGRSARPGTRSPSRARCA